jgi:hypothetical protein
MMRSFTTAASFDLFACLWLATALNIAVSRDAIAVDIQPPDSGWLEHRLGAPTLRKNKDEISYDQQAKGTWLVLAQEGRHSGLNGFVFAANWPYGYEPHPDEDSCWRTFVGLAVVEGKEQILADTYEVTNLPSGKDYTSVGMEMKARINRVTGCGGKTILEVVFERHMSGSGSFRNTADFWFEIQDSRKLKLLASQLDLDWHARTGWTDNWAQTSTITSIRSNDYCAFEITSVKEDYGGDRGLNPKKDKAKHIFLMMSEDGSHLEQVEVLPPRPANAKVSTLSRHPF